MTMLAMRTNKKKRPLYCSATNIKTPIEIKSKLKKCVVCNNLTESEKCNICDDLSRDNSIICVVEDTKNLYLFEKAGNYNGKYHVLDGLISPLNGINPEDINIDSLINRVHKENTKEVIIAVKPTIE